MTDNLAIWNAVSKTNPAHTKKVNQRGGFTSISASYQVMAATEQFGPIGIGWGYIASLPIFHDTLVTVAVTLWHGDRANTFGPMPGCEEWKDKNGRIDTDAPKKATTDAVTKLLSQLGFNADVFLGLFDDNKYVQQMEREFAAKDKAKVPASKPDDPVTDEQRDWIIGQAEKRLVTVQSLCQHFNVTSLKAFKYSQLGEILDWLKTQERAA
jgi:hypothetical protein